MQIFQYWFTESFLPWNIAKKFFNENNCLFLISIGNNNQKPKKQVIKNARILEGEIVAYYNLPGKYSYDVKIPGKMSETPSISLLPSIWQNNIPRYGELLIEIKSPSLRGDLEKVLRNMLTYRYNYDRKFQGAKYDEKGNPVNESAKIKQLFEGQKPENVIDGLFENWKFKNPTYLNEDGVKRFKQIIYMLSNYVYSNLAINKGYNDDIKLIAPYYFELLSEPKIKEGKEGEAYYEFKDCIVQLKSSYFNFSNSKITVENKDISENPIYQLEVNYFNWLSITNELETNNISSLIPAEIKLSDGEYGKYLTNLIVSNKKIEDYLNYFSQWYKLLYSKTIWTNMTKDLVEDSIKIIYDRKLFILKQIEISGIWGCENYDITILTEKEQININNLQLFNKNNEKLSLITLEI